MRREDKHTEKSYTAFICILHVEVTQHRFNLLAKGLS